MKLDPTITNFALFFDLILSALIWFDWDLFNPILSYSILFDSLWSYSILFGIIWSYLILFYPLQFCWILFSPIQSYLILSTIIRFNLNLFEPIRFYSILFNPVLPCSVLFEHYPRFFYRFSIQGIVYKYHTKKIFLLCTLNSWSTFLKTICYKTRLCFFFRFISYKYF